MPEIVLVEPARFNYGGVVFEQGVPTNVPAQMRNYLVNPARKSAGHFQDYKGRAAVPAFVPIDEDGEALAEVAPVVRTFSPAARAMLDSFVVDEALIPVGTGKDGTVTASDVTDFFETLDEPPKPRMAARQVRPSKAPPPAVRSSKLKMPSAGEGLDTGAAASGEPEVEA
jgi:pyruvate/2-oxoglutarate dehydrogenase complex dihydrolipoamide acyltransferase (E2) component